MKTGLIDPNDPRDASLRTSKRTRDALKAAAAVMGRPLYDITNEAIEKYLSGLKLARPGAMLRDRGRKSA
jgi:hypothetical protein